MAEKSRVSIINDGGREPKRCLGMLEKQGNNLVSINGFRERDKDPHLGKMEINGKNAVKCGRNIANKIHGNGLPNVRRNMERLIIPTL